MCITSQTFFKSCLDNRLNFDLLVSKHCALEHSTAKDNNAQLKPPWVTARQIYGHVALGKTQVLQIRTRHAPFFAPSSFVLKSAPVSSRQLVKENKIMLRKLGHRRIWKSTLEDKHTATWHWRETVWRLPAQAHYCRDLNWFQSWTPLLTCSSRAQKQYIKHCKRHVRTKTGKEKPQWGPVRGALSLHAAHFPRPKVKSTDVTTTFLSGLRKLHFASWLATPIS